MVPPAPQIRWGTHKYVYMYNVPEVFMVPPAPQIQWKTEQYRYISNVPEVFMVPPAPQIRWKHTTISFLAMCSGGIHGTFSATISLY